jgi:hypothetical protein
MRKLILATTCLATCLAGFVVVGQAAAALPEYMVCNKAKPGIYRDVECQEAFLSSGTFEREPWSAAAKKQITIKASAPTLYSQVPGGQTLAIACSALKGSGEITGAKSSQLSLSFSGCAIGKSHCTSAGAKSGTITTDALAGQLAYIDKSLVRVGLVLSPASGNVFAEYSCAGGPTVRTTGSVIGEVGGAVNFFGRRQTLAFAADPETAHQVLTKVEGEAGEHVLASTVTPPGGTGAAAIAASATLTTKVNAAVIASPKASPGSPEFYECDPGTTGLGRFEDKLCTVVAPSGSGFFELHPGAGKGKLHKDPAGAIRLNVGEEEIVRCGRSRDETMITSVGSELVTVIGQECTLPRECHSPGLRAGEIVTQPLVGVLDYLEKASAKVGLLLRPREGEVVARLDCPSFLGEFELRGSLVGEIDPVNVVSEGREISLLENGTRLENGEQAQLFAFFPGFGLQEADLGAGIEQGGDNEQLELRA